MAKQISVSIVKKEMILVEKILKLTANRIIDLYISKNQDVLFSDGNV